MPKALKQKQEYGIPLSRYTVFLQNCPLGHDPNWQVLFLCFPHRAVYPKKWNPVLPGRCSPGDFTAPSISQPVGTSQPKQTGGGLQTIALLQAPLINCRSQSSGYHALSRIIFKIKYPWVAVFVCTHGYI